MRTREQIYADDVYRRVSATLTELNREDQRQYGGMAHKLPILIHTAGLAQALAFVEARGKEPHKRLLQDLSRTLAQKSISEQARSADLVAYMHLTKQVLDALLWYKRFAQSVLGIDATNIDDTRSEQL